MFKKKIYLLVMSVLFLSRPVLAEETTVAQNLDTQISNQKLLQEMKAMEQRIKSLEAKVEQQQTVIESKPAQVPASEEALSNNNPPAPGNKNVFGIVNSPIEGLKFGSYGELKFGAKQNKDDNGHWQKGFDAGRFVLIPSYQFTDKISLNSEIEFEHGGTAFDNDDKLHGVVQLEQAYIDFKANDHFNFHSPGVDLVPIGYTNQHHEPTTFYSVDRPELSNGLIPTTMFVPSWGSIYGQITPNVGYQVQVSNSIEDFGDSFDNRTDGNRVKAVDYAGGVSGHEGLKLSKPPIGDFRQLNNNLAYATQVNYTPPMVPGLAGSSSIYYSPNIEPRGAHAGTSGDTLNRSSLTLVDSELRYRVPKTGLELRGEYAEAFFGKPGNLRANNDGDDTNNVGKTMWGGSGEIAYHFPHLFDGKWEAVPFYRYTYQSLQNGGFSGTDSNNPTGSGKQQFHTMGVALSPTEKLVLKLNYQHVDDKAEGNSNSDSVLGSVGFFF